MIFKPDTRVKLRRFFKKYGKFIAIVLAIWLFIILVNKLIGEGNNYGTPTTTYTPHTAVIDSTEKTPNKVKKSMEDFVKEYVEHCNKGEYEEAYNMLSEDCKNYCFIDLSTFEGYIKNKFTNEKIYSIQNYSNYNDKYIYNIKLYDDILATGLTGSTYAYLEEKITASYDKDGNVIFGAGNFIGRDEIESVQENDYLKVSVESKIVEYGYETYQVKFRNKTDKTIVVSNGYIGNEVLLKLNGEFRQDDPKQIIISPEKTATVSIVFPKFYDEKKDATGILFDSIRVVNEYIEESSNEDNAIYKFSMELGF